MNLKSKSLSQSQGSWVPLRPGNSQSGHHLLKRLLQQQGASLQSLLALGRAGATVAPPPKVQAGSGPAQTAQSSRTVLKPGNAAAKAAVPQTDAPPADQADNTLGFQTVQPRKTRGSSGRGGGTSGQGEAGSNKGGHQGPKFGQFQYHGRGGQGGNQRGRNRKGGNQVASQGQART